MTYRSRRGKPDRIRAADVRQSRYDEILFGRPPSPRTLADVNGPIAPTTDEVPHAARR